MGKERHDQVQHFFVVTLKYLKNEFAHVVTMASVIQLLISMMEKSLSPYSLNLWPCKKQVHFMTGAHFFCTIAFGTIPLYTAVLYHFLQLTS